MADFYSRVGSASLKKESTVNTAVTPDTFYGIVSEDLAAEYGFTAAMPVEANRAKNIRPVKNKIPAPQGTITVNCEPKNLGHFIRGIFGGVTTGRYIPFSGLTGTFTVGETITGGTSSFTAVVSAVGHDFLLTETPSGSFTDGETITGGSSSASATLTSYDTTVYGHLGTSPDNTPVSYTLQMNYPETAIRYMGCYFTAMDTLAQSDNIITLGIKVMAHGQFRHAKVTAVTSSGAGAKTINVDQTYGLVASDSIKVFRPSTGAFLDFSAASVKTHTIGTVASATSITITNLETSLAVDDLLVLAPQTATYTEGNEFIWIGGATYSIGAALSSLTAYPVEDFEMNVTNEYEERHAADGNNFEDLFPYTLIQKGAVTSGSLNSYYQNESLIQHLRDVTVRALQVKTVGAQIGSTGMYNELRVWMPDTRFTPYQTPMEQDAVVNEEVPFEGFYSASAGYLARALVVNDVTSY